MKPGATAGVTDSIPARTTEQMAEGTQIRNEAPRKRAHQYPLNIMKEEVDKSTHISERTQWRGSLATETEGRTQTE